MAVKILIVDDDVNTRATLSDILMKNGYKIAEAGSGEEALGKVRKERPDVVLLDTRLPGINGNEVCRQIKKIKELAVKVIAYTGNIDAVDAGKARAAGADDYVVKTSDFSLLLKAIESSSSACHKKKENA